MPTPDLFFCRDNEAKCKQLKSTKPSLVHSFILTLCAKETQKHQCFRFLKIILFGVLYDIIRLHFTVIVLNWNQHSPVSLHGAMFKRVHLNSFHLNLLKKFIHLLIEMLSKTIKLSLVSLVKAIYSLPYRFEHLCITLSLFNNLDICLYYLTSKCILNISEIFSAYSIYLSWSQRFEFWHVLSFL